MTAVPAATYHFVQWSDGSTDNPRTDTNVTSDITVTASFAIDTFSLSYSAGANGSLTGSTSQTVDHGADGTAVTAVPAATYHFVQWSDGSTDNPRTDTNVTGDITVTASFAIDTFGLTYSAGANGSIVGSTSQTVNYGSDGTAVTAVPAATYHFVQWSDGSTDNPRTDTNVTGDITVTASFAIDTFSLTYIAGANGSIVGSTSQTVNYGSDGTAVTAVPAATYHFVQWSDGSTDNPRTDTNVTGDVTVTASFAIDTFSLTYSAGANGSIVGSTSQTVNYGSDGTAVTSVPDATYHFVQWSDGSTDNPRTDTNVTGDITVTASFAIDTFSLTYSAGANGSLMGSTSQTVNHGSDGTAVTAVPDANHHFVQWSDGSTDNPRTDANVQGDITVTATFTVDVFTVTFAAGPGGFLAGVTSQNVAYGADCSAITATGTVAHHFVNWTGPNGFTSTSNTLTVTNVTQDAMYKANFHIDAHTVIFTAGEHGSLAGSVSQMINHGGDCEPVTAIADEHCHFVNWTGSDNFTSTDNPLAVSNVTAEATYTANFASGMYTVTFATDEHGSLSGQMSQTVEYGQDTAPVTALPAAGCHFVRWTGPGDFVSTDNPLIVPAVSGDGDYTAHFAAIECTLSFFAGEGGTLTGLVEQVVELGGSAAAVTAVPAEGYHFVNWIVDRLAGNLQQQSAAGSKRDSQHDRYRPVRSRPDGAGRYPVRFRRWIARDRGRGALYRRCCECRQWERHRCTRPDAVARQYRIRFGHGRDRLNRQVGNRPGHRRGRQHRHHAAVAVCRRNDRRAPGTPHDRKRRYRNNAVGADGGTAGYRSCRRPRGSAHGGHLYADDRLAAVPDMRDDGLDAPAGPLLRPGTDAIRRPARDALQVRQAYPFATGSFAVQTQ